MNEPNKVVLKICDTKLVLDFDAAANLARLLCAENLQQLTQDYRKDPSGNYGCHDQIKKVRMGDVSLSFIPAVDYFRLCEEGDKNA